MKVECAVEYGRLQGRNGRLVASVTVTCGRCDHEIEVYGNSDASIKRGLATLREECPNDEENFYVCEEVE